MSPKPHQSRTARTRLTPKARPDTYQTTPGADRDPLSSPELAELSLTGIAPAGANLEWLLDKADFNNGQSL